MPSLGADMESGTLVEWKVKPGDRVKRGDLIATVETVKGAIEIEVFQDAVIEQLLVEPGAQVPVNGVMALLRGPAEVAPPPDAATAAMRGAIAAAMSRSKREIPHYYLATDLDFGRSQSWLEQQNAQRPVTERLLPVALLLRATVLAVREVPELNGTYREGAFHPGEAVNLAVAISLRAGGLIAPVILEAQQLTVGELMARLSDLVARTRSNALRSSELGTGTLTVSNLGDQGVGLVFPVIQPPQVAMVGFGRITRRPWVVDGTIAATPVVTASLAGDHRVSDGHRGGRFLAAIEKLLLEPEKL